MIAIRPFAVAAAAAVLLAVGGIVAELVVFGASAEATAGRLEREVRDQVASQAREVRALAGAVAADAPLIARAIDSNDQLDALFEQLARLVGTAADEGLAAAVYVPVAGAAGFRPLAWSDGAGEDAPLPERLAGPAAIFVAPGHAGLRLLNLEPIASDSGQRLAVVVAEAVLVPRTPGSVESQMATSYGPVDVVGQFALARDEIRTPNAFVIRDGDVPLVEVHFDPADLAGDRAAFRRRVWAVALLPLALLLGLAVPGVLRQTSLTGSPWRPMALAAALVAVAAAATAGAARLIDAPGAVHLIIAALALLALAAIGPGLWWWRPRRRRAAASAPGRFILEQVLAGLVVAAGLEVVSRLVAAWTTPAMLAEEAFLLAPPTGPVLLGFGALLIFELAAAWTTGLTLASISARWQIDRPGVKAVAGLCWVLPSLVVMPFFSSRLAEAWPHALWALAAAVAFGLGARQVRHVYRTATQSMRLLIELLAIALPLLALYPMLAAAVDRTTRQVIETEYAPATAEHPQELREQLAQAQRAIDALTTLPELVSGPPSSGTQAAYLVWSKTNLASTRVVSDVELYGPEGALVSRFAFNLPEYVYRVSQPWQATSCDWDVYGEVTPFGAEARLVLHAMRGVCGPDGRIDGGIVVHVASHDYEALPFIASVNPYMEMLGAADPDVPRLPDLQVTVYGWSYQTIFSSGRVAWPVPTTVFERLYADGTPFWTTLSADGRAWRVHFSQNRGGIYALGYPLQTPFGRATRLAEIVTLAAAFFVLVQVGATLSAPFLPRGHSALRRLFQEIRTSFYRKLFLFFVAVAIVPVLLFAVAFGSYTTARFQADVESEAKTTVTIAHRVFDELVAADERFATTVGGPSDDVMVWIRQVIGQDVNLFEGPELVATSQRDLFDSGLLPTRTPANVYRRIVLQRLPQDVVVDRLGGVSYLVVAAPVASRGREAILTVPLAPRQRDIERETSELRRGVLVGSVLVVMLAAGLGASLAGRIADPVSRLSRATRQIAAGDLDVRVTADGADELQRLVDDFNTMAGTLAAQRTALARTHQIKAWNEMARQVAHEIKNPLTPIQLAAEHLQHVHEDRRRPLGTIVDQCLGTILAQVRLLRRIASEFANFAGEPTPRPEAIDLGRLVARVVDPYRTGLEGRVEFDIRIDPATSPVWADPTLLSRALTNLVENAVQAMPDGGRLTLAAEEHGERIALQVVDTGTGMDEDALVRAFDPFFSTKTGGSGLGLANARRNIETAGGTVGIASQPGAGTTVTVSLPRPPRPDASAAASSATR